MKVYKCDKCSKTLLSKEAVVLAGWTELVAGSTDAAQEKHVPVVTKNGNVVKVDVGSVAHPMTQEHWIEWVAVETANGFKVQYLKAGDAPVYEFTLSADEEVVGVYAYCNLHGLWKA